MESQEGIGEVGSRGPRVWPSWLSAEVQHSSHCGDPGQWWKFPEGPGKLVSSVPSCTKRAGGFRTSEPVSSGQQVSTTAGQSWAQGLQLFSHMHVVLADLL